MPSGRKPLPGKCSGVNCRGAVCAAVRPCRCLDYTHRPPRCVKFPRRLSPSPLYDSGGAELSAAVFPTRLVMSLKDAFRSRSLSSAVALCLLFSATAPAQEEEVVRITTELVQTDVAVFDKRGRFVDDLRPEQFELQVNGRTQAVTFFERVRAGSRGEEAQLAAVRRR